MRLFFSWLRPGQLPIYDFGEDVCWHYVETEYGPPCWTRAATFRNRALIPVSEFVPIERLRETLQTLPCDGTLVVSVRAVQLQGDFHYILAAIAVVETPIPDWRPDLPQVELVDGQLPAEAFELLGQLLRIQSCTEEPEHPTLRDAWQCMEVWRRDDEEWQAEHEALRKEEDAAKAKAKILLCSHLDEGQRAMFEKDGFFLVSAADGLLYRIHTANHGNVFRIIDDKAVVNFCLVARDVEIPVFDLMLAQKIMLESDLETFMTLANATVLTPEVQEADPALIGDVLRRQDNVDEIRRTIAAAQAV